MRQKAAEVDQRLALLESAVRQSPDDLEKVAEECATLRAAFAESEKRNAVLEAAVKELKATSEKWGQRWWQLAAGAALLLVGGVAGYLFKR